MKLACQAELRQGLLLRLLLPRPPLPRALCYCRRPGGQGERSIDARVERTSGLATPGGAWYMQIREAEMHDLYCIARFTPRPTLQCSNVLIHTPAPKYPQSHNPPCPPAAAAARSRSPRT